MLAPSASHPIVARPQEKSGGKTPLFSVNLRQALSSSRGKKLTCVFCSFFSLPRAGHLLYKWCDSTSMCFADGCQDLCLLQPSVVKPYVSCNLRLSRPMPLATFGCQALRSYLVYDERFFLEGD